MKRRILNLILVLSLLTGMLQPCFAVQEIPEPTQDTAQEIQTESDLEQPSNPGTPEQPLEPEIPEQPQKPAAIELETAENTVDGIRLTWKPAADAEGYYILRREEQGEWKQVAEILPDEQQSEQAEYLDPEFLNDAENLVSGTVYRYAVQSHDLEGNVSEHSEEGTAVRWLSAPKLEIEGTAETIKLSWNAVKGAAGYRVYRKSADTEWSVQKTVEQTALTETLPMDSVTYLYTIEAFGAEDAVSARREGTTAAALSMPEISVANIEKDVRISWSKVDCAEGYRVYRKIAGGKWKRIANVTDAVSYLDHNGIESGKSYIYTVRAVLGNILSSYKPEGFSIVYLPAPDLSLASDSKSATVSWTQVNGASGYIVYHKAEGESKWTRIAKVGKDVRSYKDSTVKTGECYTYTVKAYQGTTNGGYLRQGVQTQILAVPTVKAVCKDNTATATWNPIEGAELYQVYHSVDGAKWKLLKLVDADTLSWTEDLTEYAGSKVRYTVRAKSDTGRSAYVSSNTVQYLTPVDFTPANAPDGIRITWKEVRGAETYRVYRKNEEGKWVRIATVKSDTLSVTDKNVENAEEYTYTARAVSSLSISSYAPEGTPCYYLAAPKVSVSCTAGSSSIKWDAIEGAEHYQVYRRLSGEKWKKLGETDALSWKDDLSKQEGGTVYYYTVRAYSELGRSSYTSSGSVTYLLPPSFSLSNEAGGIQVKWKASAGASEYRVYRKSGNQKWKRIATLSGSKRSYLDKNAENGVKYAYTVRAAAVNSLSGYKPEGTSITCSSYKTALANNQLPTNIALPNVTREKYGTSGEGRALYAYSVGTGKNHMVLNFAIHGWEDNWSRDGYELVRVAVKVLEKLSANASVVKQNGWTVTVIPYANPDGIVSGTTNNGPGRCTTYRYNTSGKLVRGGVDLNRCFPTGFSQATSARNYTGPDPLMAREAKALHSLIGDREGSGSDIFIDVHGWTQQILTNSSGSGRIYRTLHEYFPNNSAGGLGGGYAARYAKAIGYDACLFEFPRNVTSHSAMTSKGYDTKFVNAVMDLIREY